MDVDSGGARPAGPAPRRARASLRLLLLGYVALVVVYAGSVLALLVVDVIPALPLDQAAELARAMRLAGIYALSGLVLLVLTGWLLLRRIEPPLRALEEGFARVRRGDYEASVPVFADDEIGRLARLFNETTQALRLRAEQQGRFAAAGQLLADVAHEVNNPLMAISTLVEARRGDRSPETSLRDDMELIRKQARRASKLLAGLLRFVRVAEVRHEPLDVNRVAHDAADLLSYQFGVDEITLTWRLDQRLRPAMGDPQRLEQVLVNLISNSVDAMRGVPSPRWLLIESWSHDGRLHLAVADTGTGIPTSMRERLFQPFSSTKGAKGNGLGLWISRQIMREAGGDLVYVPGDGGARFEAWLPEAPPGTELPRTPEGGTITPEGSRPLEGIRVLLVEDEEAIRAPVARYLRRRGATVLEAVDGLVALEQLERALDLDVIVADLRMPRMDGSAFFAEVRDRYASLAGRVVFLSGDLSLVSEGEGLVPPERLLLKPVDLKAIEVKLLEVSGGGRTPGTAPSPQPAA